jgi:hypothetical protein
LSRRAISVTFLMFPSLRHPTIRNSKSIKLCELAISLAFHEHELHRRVEDVADGLRLREEDAANEVGYIVIDNAVFSLRSTWIGRFMS